MSKESLPVQFLKFFISYVLGIPLLFLLQPVFFFHERIVDNDWFKPKNNPRLHAKKVQGVQQQVRAWNDTGRKTQMCSARKAWKSVQTHNINKSKYTQIILDLGDIVEIDTDKKILVVEPEMTMGKLTAALLPLGWTIPVVPELEFLTVGGLICGAGIESSSHKYGLFHDTCLSYEVVLADGSVVNCSKKENVDLFHALPGSLGTLGFLTSATVQLIPAKKYVKLEYFPINTLAQTVNMLKRPETYENEFVEGFTYNLEQSVMMVGNMTDLVEPAKVNEVNAWYKPYFYKQVEAFLGRPSGIYVEYIPLRQYYHRHSRGFFWLTPKMVPLLSTHPIFLTLFGWLLPINIQLLKRIAPKDIYEKFMVENTVIQDFGIQLEHLEGTIRFFHDVVEVYPLWLCPAKLFAGPGYSRNKDKDVIVLDLGVYGTTGKPDGYEPEKTTRILEKHILATEGYQAPYADTYLTFEEASQMLDTTLYHKVRAQLDCADAFPDAYQKYCRQERNF